MISVVSADGSVSGLMVLDLEAAVLEVALLLSPPAELSRATSLLCDLSLVRPRLSLAVGLLCCLVRVFVVLGVVVRGFARAPVEVVPLTVVVAQALVVRWLLDF